MTNLIDLAMTNINLFTAKGATPLLLLLLFSNITRMRKAGGAVTVSVSSRMRTQWK